MPNGRPRSQRSRHANNRRNTRRDVTVGTESNPIIACPVYPDIEGTPPTSPVEVVTQSDQVSGLNEQIRDLTKVNENLIKEFQRTKKTNDEMILALAKLEKELRMFRGNYEYMKLAMIQLGEELEFFGYGHLDALEIALDSNYKPKKNVYGTYSHPFQLEMCVVGPPEQQKILQSCLDADGEAYMPVLEMVKRGKAKGFNGKIMTLKDLQMETQKVRDDLKEANQKNDRLKEIALKSSLKCQQLEDAMKGNKTDIPELLEEVFINRGMVVTEVKAPDSVDQESQTDEMCFYDTDMKGWCGY